MIRCLITGATGFLGQYLVDALLLKDVELTLLVRNTESPDLVRKLKRWEEQREGSATINLIQYDLLHPDLGLNPSVDFSQFDHFFHLAAIYDLASSATVMHETNVIGTERILSHLESARFTGIFHFISSIAIAGDYKGTFNELMFDEGQSHQHPYHRSKFEAEKIVRNYKSLNKCTVRIYRPSAIVGHSQTGHIDKVDGPYYAFLLISALKRWIPSKVPLFLPRTKITLDIVPVDFVANSIACISLLPKGALENGQFCFHLSDPETPSISQLFSKVLSLADGPSIGLSASIDPLTKLVSGGQFRLLWQLQAVQLINRELLKALDIPETVFQALMPNLRFEASLTQKLLSQYSITPPNFNDYAEVLWDFYNKNLDPKKNRAALARKKLKDKKVLITGGSSGIGYESAKLAYSLGAEVILVARDVDKLKECESEIKLMKTEGGRIHSVACDLSDLNSCDELIDYIETNFSAIDIVFSNAGRSIRRSISKSQGRFHDLQRTMQLNYFGAARLILGLIPSMIKQGGGQVIHSSSMGTLSATPRFGAYMASKIALDTLMDSMAAEFSHQNIYFSSIKFPLVQTPMVAPTQEFKQSKLTTPEQAAQMFLDVVIDKNRIKTSGSGKLLNLVSLVSPNFMTQLYNYGFKVWPDDKEDYPEMGLDRMLMKYFLPHSPL